MRGLLTLVLALSVVSPAWAQAEPGTPPTAPEPRAAEAKQRYENGMAHFNLEEWDKAIDEWKAGYRAKPVPQFLYNIAQAYRLSKHYEESLSFYQRYLRAEPKAPNMKEVEGHISKLTNLLAQEKKTQSAPPILTMAVKPKGAEGTPGTTSIEPSPAPVVAPAAPTTPTTTTVTTVQKEPDRPTPVTKKKWFWPVIGVVAGVVVVAVVVGAAVGATSGGDVDNTKVLPLARF
jgi:hypothetical protein